MDNQTYINMKFFESVSQGTFNYCATVGNDSLYIRYDHDPVNEGPTGNDEDWGDVSILIKSNDENIYKMNGGIGSAYFNLCVIDLIKQKKLRNPNEPDNDDGVDYSGLDMDDD